MMLMSSGFDDLMISCHDLDPFQRLLEVLASDSLFRFGTPLVDCGLANKQAVEDCLHNSTNLFQSMLYTTSIKTLGRHLLIHAYCSLYG